MSGKVPCKDISLLIAACQTASTTVYVSQGAQETASSHFGLLTMDRIVAFIAAGGLDKLRHVSREPWQNNRDKAHPIDVDAYEFYSGSKQGYVAYFFNPATSKWIVKSFKQNSHSPLSTSLGEKLRKALAEGEERKK